ncbi:hypothetical protein MIMGU_mgv1a017375mg [Erythranthe guttata]|uniref:Uncharacterized protein n=1 Tax=Erythranthe guttata TaxID=4155 RepID=A0A022Q255_ERYGU|nr:hypothetical protein MIMGU_mgv1a017375mg [Erythranthe guttata]
MLKYFIHSICIDSFTDNTFKKVLNVNFDFRNLSRPLQTSTSCPKDTAISPFFSKHNGIARGIQPWRSEKSSIFQILVQD